MQFAIIKKSENHMLKFVLLIAVISSLFSAERKFMCIFNHQYDATEKYIYDSNSVNDARVYRLVNDDELHLKIRSAAIIYYKNTEKKMDRGEKKVNVIKFSSGMGDIYCLDDFQTMFLHSFNRISKYDCSEIFEK